MGKKICHALSVSVFAARHRGFGRCFVFWNDQLIRSVRLPERSFRDGGKLEHVSFVDGWLSWNERWKFLSKISLQFFYPKVSKFLLLFPANSLILGLLSQRSFGWIILWRWVLMVLVLQGSLWKLMEIFCICLIVRVPLMGFKISSIVFVAYRIFHVWWANDVDFHHWHWNIFQGA